MKIDIEHRPAYALAIVHLEANEVVVAEGGAMVSMDTHLKCETSAGKKDQGLMGSLFSGLKRSATERRRNHGEEELFHIDLG